MNQNAKNRVEYTPESPLRHPGALFRSMFSDLAASFRLGARLARRDLSAQYRQTLLGWLWAVLPPLATSLVFLLLHRGGVIRARGLDTPYAVFVLTGTIFWQVFVDALNAPLKMLQANRAMLSKINFPREALLVSGIFQVLFGFAVKAALLALALACFRTPVHPWGAAALISLAGLLGAGTLCGVLLVPVGALYQDVQQGLAVVTGALLFLAPVVVPVPDAGVLARVMKANPLTPFFSLCRDSLFSGRTDSLGPALAVLAACLVLGLGGWVLYRVALPILIERMDA